MRSLVVPMAGEGRRFGNSTTPKVLIPIGDEGVPMFCLAVRSVGFSFDRLVLVARREHDVEPVARTWLGDDFDLDVVELDATSGGPLDSVLHARPLLEKVADDELVVCNADQVMVWPGDWALDWFRRSGAVGGMPTLERHSERHSYARIDPERAHRVLEVREKQRISSRATIGVYWFASATAFLTAAERMIAAGDRAPNGEFYVGPVYNWLDGLVLEYPLCEFWSLGEPHNLDAYLAGRPQGAADD